MQPNALGRPARLLTGAAVLFAACGGGGSGAPPAPTRFELGMAPTVVEDADDVKLFSLGFGNSVLPSSASWVHTLPPVGDQGAQASCVAWATGYYVKTSWEQREEGWSTSVPSRQFSPAWIYDQIKGSDCHAGSQVRHAMELLKRSGCATLATAPYSDASCSTQPSAAATAEASGFKNLGYREFGSYDLRGFKEYLARTGPLVFGIQVHQDFLRTGAIYSQVSGAAEGGHAVACVGYDDGVAGGAFRLVNSWGPSWADAGFVWVTYVAMERIFLGAWAMRDGPNTGGGRGSTPLPAPGGFHASQTESDFYVWTVWNFMSGASSYTLQRKTPTGAWQTIAQAPSDTYYHYDFDVEPSTVYEYRVAGVNAVGTVGSWAMTSGSTAARGAITPLTLTASHPTTGISYPDRIALNWTFAPGNHWYVLVRADSSEGLRVGQFFILHVARNGSSYDDYVSPGSNFSYAVFSVDAVTSRLSGVSEVVDGSTSGVRTGQDLGILDAAGPAVVTRGQASLCGVTLFNYSLSTSPSQRLTAGIEYYFADGSYGILWYWNSAWTQPIYDAATGTPLPSFHSQSWIISPRVPEYLYPEGTAAVAQWWFFYTDPLDASNAVLPDVYPWDNGYYTTDALFVQ
jgi:hypothetical protein